VVDSGSSCDFYLRGGASTMRENAVRRTAIVWPKACEVKVWLR
jgi:hypothetical protein